MWSEIRYQLCWRVGPCDDMTAVADPEFPVGRRGPVGGVDL